MGSVTLGGTAPDGADGRVEPSLADPGIPPWREVLDLDTIRAAARRLRAVEVETPLQRSERLSARYDASVYLKREDLQAVRSYKIRGAFTFITSLTAGELAAGVVCASAGNHAQGVAWSCRHLGVRGVVFLPRRTPRQKVDRIRSFGQHLVEVRFAGEDFDEALAAANAYAVATGATVVPAFDHPVTIAGQGTVMLEVASQLPEPADFVIVPIGGGGLISGVAAAIDGLRAPSRVIGAQPGGAPAMAASIVAGRPVVIDIADDFVDGAVVRTPGVLPFAVVSELVDEIVTVDEGEVSTELLALYQEDGIVTEPAGALSVAALDQLGSRLAGRTVVCIVSGGNNDVARYAEIVERSLVHRGLKHYFMVQFPQRPGALRQFLDTCLGPSDDITLFEYVKKSSREFGPALVGIELADQRDLAPLRERMTASGLAVEPVAPDSAVFRFLV
jgi:threonine dehydratase